MLIWLVDFRSNKSRHPYTTRPAVRCNLLLQTPGGICKEKRDPQ